MVRTKLVTLTPSLCVISRERGKGRLMRAWSAFDFGFGWKGKRRSSLTLPGNVPVSRRDERWRLPPPLLSHPTSEISFQSPCSINLCSFFYFTLWRTSNALTQLPMTADIQLWRFLNFKVYKGQHLSQVRRSSLETLCHVIRKAPALNHWHPLILKWVI